MPQLLTASTSQTENAGTSRLADRLLLEDYIRIGCNAAFAELVRRYTPMVRARACRITGNSATAEDVTQECFLRMATSAIDIRVSIGGWLRRMALNLAMDIKRGERRRLRRELAAASPDIYHDTTAERQDQERLLRNALVAIPRHRRLLLYLRYYRNVTQRQVSLRFQVSEATISRQLAEGLRQLRTALRSAAKEKV